MRLLLPSGATGSVEAPDLQRLYRPPPGRHVRANLVVSVDGAVELDGVSGGLGGPGDRAVFAVLRAMADVVVAGSGTVKAEDYGPVRVSPSHRAERAQRGQPPDVPVAVVTNRADLDPASRLFHADGGARPIVITCTSATEARRRALHEVADVVVCGDQQVDDALALDALADRGLLHVLCEGGPTLVTRWMAGALVDELCVSHAPVLAGPGRFPLSAGVPFEHPVRLRLAHLLEADGILIGRYAVTRADDA